MTFREKFQEKLDSAAGKGEDIQRALDDALVGFQVKVLDDVVDSLFPIIEELKGALERSHKYLENLAKEVCTSCGSFTIDGHECECEYSWVQHKNAVALNNLEKWLEKEGECG